MVIKKTVLKSGVTINDCYIKVSSIGGENFIAQAYLHLKSLPEFSGSQDC